jgi:hypothetical protein
MITSPYSIPSSKKALEVTGTPYYVPTASSKTVSAVRDNNGFARAMSITREEPQSSQPAQISSNMESSSTLSNSSSSTVIYVPVATTATSTQPFGMPIAPTEPVTPTFSVGMKNDKH